MAKRSKKTNWNIFAFPHGTPKRKLGRAGSFRRLLPNRREWTAAIMIGLISAGLWLFWTPEHTSKLAGAVPVLESILGSANTSGEVIQGQAVVVDGDTLEIHGERIRILDVDAPESRQDCMAEDGSKWRCGQKAARELDQWIGSRTVTCEPTGKDRYGRWLAHCAVGGQDIGQWLAQSGWAVPYRDCGCVVIRAASLQAQAAGTGIWAGTFQMPWEWRRSN